MKFNDMGYTRMEMSLNTYQHLSKRTLPTGKHSEGLANYALGLVCEAGETGDHIKKHLFHGHDLDDEKVKGELGDVMHYVAGVCTMLGYTLEEVCTYNVEKLMKRFPNGFNTEDSKKRVDTKTPPTAEEIWNTSIETADIPIGELKVKVPNMLPASYVMDELSKIDKPGDYTPIIQLMRNTMRENIPDNFDGIAVERSVRKPGYYEQVNLIYSKGKPIKRITVRILESGEEQAEVQDIEERECPQCLGTGNDNITGFECCRCSGTGRVIV